MGVFVVKNGKFLVGKRKSSHGFGTWAPPGGHLEFGEDLEECVKREVKEEAGLEIKDCEFLGITNDIFPEGKHYVTLWFLAKWESGDPKVLEPEKCEEWKWVKLEDCESIENLFLPLKNFLKNKALVEKVEKRIRQISFT